MVNDDPFWQRSYIIAIWLRIFSLLMEIATSSLSQILSETNI